LQSSSNTTVFPVQLSALNKPIRPRKRHPNTFRQSSGSDSWNLARLCCGPTRIFGGQHPENFKQPTYIFQARTYYIMAQSGEDLAGIGTLLDTDGSPIQEYSRKDQTWGTISHLSALVGFLGIPFGHIIGPLVVWLIKGQSSAFVEDQARESLNFQITISLLEVVAWVLTLIFVGWAILAILFLANLVLVVLGAVRASSGEAFRYPFNLRLIGRRSQPKMERLQGEVE